MTLILLILLLDLLMKVSVLCVEGCSQRLACTQVVECSPGLHKALDAFECCQCCQQGHKFKVYLG